MLRRGLSIFGAHLFKNTAFRFHAVRCQAVAKQVRLTTLPMKRFSSNLPPHQVLNVLSAIIQMPALSPTMTGGKVVKWYKKVGDPIEEGDVLCDVETDKATVPFEMVEKGFVAKILLAGDEEVKVGAPVVVIVSKKDAVSSFDNYSGAAGSAPKAAQPTTEAPAEKKVEKQTKQEEAPVTKASTPSKGENAGNRTVASPLAKKSAQEVGVELTSIQGSGPNGRIIKQDVDQAQKVAAEQKPAPQVEKAQPASKKKVPENPFEEIPLTSTRKTIAARLVESKTTIPHYYVQVDINMDETIKIREELNKLEKENGVKISINDFVMRATALASRDFPDTNVTWGDKALKKYTYVDLAMAVATEKGLITPIIFRADTKGLLDIAKASKDLAKRAR